MQFVDPEFEAGFDAVVMLTVSDWKSEPRSNRYHYATRFAAGKRVVFVQPDRQRGYEFEDSGQAGIELLHVPADFGPEQSAAIATALAQRGVLRPLLWIYSGNYVDAVERIYAPLCVLHATEDYFSPELRRQALPGFYERLARLFARLDLLVAVSPGVLHSYRVQGGYQGEALLLENGCDYKFIRGVVDALPQPAAAQDVPLAFYQGGINYRLDFALLLELARRKADWNFEFCGRVTDPPAEWNQLLALPNVRHLGELSPRDVMRAAAHATVGLMPFLQTPFIQQKSLPLKAFEYAACGLPVAGVPIDALARWPELFLQATDVAGFDRAMEKARTQRHDPACTAQRLAVAAQQDYDARFALLQQELATLLARDPVRHYPKLNVLVLYASNSTYTPTVLEYVASFARFSSHRISFADAINGADAFYDMGQFDVILVHYSVRLTLADYIAPAVVQGIKASGAFRILTIQDEYENTESARRWMDELGFHAIFTCIPDGQATRIYPRERFPGTELIPILTGYVPEVLEQVRGWKPLRERPITIGYRGRRLPFHYGRLGQEKYEIGVRMRELCAQRNVTADIEWDESKRIYGDRWYEFIGNCRAMLGSESGSNAFDEDGTLQSRGDAALKENPSMTFEEYHERFLKDIDGNIQMNQVSARVFEAIALGTPLILFEGQYSGAVQPDVHYLSLKKDFSNVDDILRRLDDLPALEAMAQRAYRDVIASGRYSYRKFVQALDRFTSERVRFAKPWLPLGVTIGAVRTDAHDEVRMVQGRVPRGAAVNWPLPYARYDEAAAAAMQVLAPRLVHEGEPSHGGVTPAQGAQMPSALAGEEPPSRWVRLRQAALLVWSCVPEPTRAVLRPAVNGVLRPLARGLHGLHRVRLQRGVAASTADRRDLP